MGFPLSLGTCEQGMITCHWHHARFDANSGGTFDAWADDVDSFDVELRGEEVYVSDRPRPREPVAHAWRRLREGLEQNTELIVAKAILTLRGAGVPDVDIVRAVALFGCQCRDSWSMGMTVLAAMANVAPQLAPETVYLALYQGARRVAADCSGQPPRRDLPPLGTDDIALARLGQWLRYWTLVRHAGGATRTLLTALHRGASDKDMARLMFTAATERFFADAGHLMDFCNKAFEVLDLIGWQHATEVLPALVTQLTSARGGEESGAWRHPIDLVALVRNMTTRLPSLLEAGRNKVWGGETTLAETMLGEDPEAILDGIADAVSCGARPDQLGRSLAYAAAMRIARFGTNNELSDWINALHTFSYCNALHRALKRCPEPELVPGVLHGAMAVYLERFLNVPPAKLPGEYEAREALPAEPEQLLETFLATLDRQQQVERAGQIVAKYLELGHPVSPLIETMALAVVREDANFHTLQMLEAGIRQFHEWPAASEQAQHILVAVARYLAAHSPTPRSQLQTATIALRLYRGDEVYKHAE
jgi:hypothetical protein